MNIIFDISQSLNAQQPQVIHLAEVSLFRI